MRFARVGDSDWAFAANVSIGRPAAVAVLIFKLLNDTTDSITVSNDLTGKFSSARLAFADARKPFVAVLALNAAKIKSR
jgi:hypothetical protein